MIRSVAAPPMSSKAASFPLPPWELGGFMVRRSRRVSEEGVADGYEKATRQGWREAVGLC